MQWRALILLALLALLAPSWGHAQSSLPLAKEELLHSARAWEAHDRGDLAILALEKLVAARPDSSEALLELGELHLRMGDVTAAGRVRERLRTRFKDSQAARTFETEYRFATRDRLQLASLQRLLQIKRSAQARLELERLFPDGAPLGTLGIEYYRLLASTPGGLTASEAGMRRLAASHAEDPRYQLALGKLLLRRQATALEGLRLLQSLVKRDDVRMFDVDDALLGAIRDLGVRAPTHVLQSYLTRHPDEAVAQEALATQARVTRERQLLAANPLRALRADVWRRCLEDLDSALTSTNRAEAERALQFARAMRGEQPGRADESMLAAITWLQRAQGSLASRRLELAAAQLDAAMALRSGRYEAAIAIAEQLESLHQSVQSDELLALANHLAPKSNWLFETRMRWLIDQQREGEALAAIEARPLDRKWTAATRDALQATALEQRAQRSLDAGEEALAVADLEAAIRLVPTHPWSRYRLAGLYARRGDPERGRQLFESSAAAAARPEMRYAQSLYLSSIGAADDAFAAIDAIEPRERNAGMHSQHSRLRMQRARTLARRQHEAGHAGEARATLLEVEPLAREASDLARALAFAWIDIDEPQRALDLIRAQRQRAGNDGTELLLVEAEVLNRLDDVAQLPAVLDQLRVTELDADSRAALARLQRSLDLRVIRALMAKDEYSRAAARLDALLEADPGDRTLRRTRAELDLARGQPRAARDRYAALVAEEPDDLDTRLSYVRALTDSGDVALARSQLQAVQELVPAEDVELQLDIARRQLALEDAPGAVRTLEGVLALQPERADVLLALGRAELSQRHFTKAREYFARAERGTDAKLALQARLAGEQIDTRLQSHMESAFEIRRKPGDAGISQYDARVMPNFWRHALDFERRITAHADAVSIDSGRLSPLFEESALLGTIQAAGPDAPRTVTNASQSGVALALGYETDTWSADLGTTPLGFLLPNVLGGVEWTPKWGPLDLSLGLERRAVTSSVLSFAGLRDPISGRKWGGVVETGPYAQAGLYRERYSLTAAMRFTELTGTNVLDNRFMGLRGAADWRFFASDTARAFVGLTLNHWRYQHNLQEYTFGHGGYYSPQSYLSIALPTELQGSRGAWSYHLRATLAHSTSKTGRNAFYPTDAALQAAAQSMPLPGGFDAPFFSTDSGGGASFSFYAALERQMTPHLVIGAKLDLDRSDFYEPTVLMLYLRHVFGTRPTRLAVPPQPVRPYNR